MSKIAVLFYKIEPKIIVDKLNTYINYTTNTDKDGLKHVKFNLKRTMENGGIYKGCTLYNYIEQHGGIRNFKIIPLDIIEFDDNKELLMTLDNLRNKHKSYLGLRLPDINEDTCCHNKFKLNCEKCLTMCDHYLNRRQCPLCPGTKLESFSKTLKKLGRIKKDEKDDYYDKE